MRPLTNMMLSHMTNTDVAIWRFGFASTLDQAANADTGMSLDAQTYGDAETTTQRYDAWSCGHEEATTQRYDAWSCGDVDMTTQRYDLRPLEDKAMQRYNCADAALCHWF